MNNHPTKEIAITTLKYITQQLESGERQLYNFNIELHEHEIMGLNIKLELPQRLPRIISKAEASENATKEGE